MRIDQVRQRLAIMPTHLPPTPPALVPVALAAHGETTPRIPRWPVERRRAAVMVLFHPAPRSDEAQVVLIERSSGPHRHAGQVSFPGGALEGDESAVEAALRETAEEIGLDAHAASVKVAGVLPQVDVPVSGFLVDQVVGFVDELPTLTPDGREVAAVFSAPVDAFLPGAPIEMVTEPRDGFVLRYGAYRVGRWLVWGATAGMLARLGAYLDSG